MGGGSLVVVGTGFGGCGQITADASQAIATAEKVLFLVTDPATREWILTANPTAESLDEYYSVSTGRLNTYVGMTEHIISFVRSGLRVCVAFYGHPGVFVFASHEAITRCRDECLSARMVPGVSAEDCLFADLGIDPGRRGCLTVDATDFLVRHRTADPAVPLVLWQAGAVGRVDHVRDDNHDNIAILADVLRALYGGHHEVVIYEASRSAEGDPRIECVRLEDLADAGLGLVSTLFVPPRVDAQVDEEMARRLGLPAT